MDHKPTAESAVSTLPGRRILKVNSSDKKLKLISKTKLQEAQRNNTKHPQSVYLGLFSMTTTGTFFMSFESSIIQTLLLLTEAK